jgi:hypothetical protein
MVFFRLLYYVFMYGSFALFLGTVLWGTGRVNGSAGVGIIIGCYVGVALLFSIKNREGS